MIALAAGFALGAAAAALVLEVVHARKRRRLGRFFSFAAHEVNTPITALNMTILNFATGVFGEVPAEQKRWFDILREQTARLNAMVGELRDLIHLEINRDLRIEVEEVDAEAAMRRAAESVAHGLSQSGATVSVEAEPGLPRIKADEERFCRTLISLLHHARKFRAGGDVRLRAFRAPGSRTRVEVSYTGRPLDAGTARRCLELLYPADAPTGASAATGLGLGLLRELVRRQGGELRFEVGAQGAATLRLEMLDWTP